jgi:hypothetical protein
VNDEPLDSAADTTGALDRDKLRETEGMPLVLPNEVEGPARRPAGLSMYTGNLGVTGLSLRTGDDSGAAVSRLGAVVAAVAVTRFLSLGPAGLVALAALFLVLVEIGRWLAPRLGRRRIEFIQERSRRELLRRRARHVSDAALSRSADRDADADRGVSRGAPPPR